MAQHVYARLSGFGWILLPLAPFQLQGSSDKPRRILARHDSLQGPRQAAVTLEGNSPTVELGKDTAALEEVLDMMEGPDLDHWRIETSVYTCGWPAGFTLTSNNESARPAFFLKGPDAALLFVQGPFAITRLPSLSDMVGPGQKLRRQGRSARGGWVELEYQHENRPWLQTHRLIEDVQEEVFVVTAQTPETGASLTDTAAEEIVRSFALYEDG